MADGGGLFTIRRWLWSSPTGKIPWNTRKIQTKFLYITGHDHISNDTSDTTTICFVIDSPFYTLRVEEEAGKRNFLFVLPFEKSE